MLDPLVPSLVVLELAAGSYVEKTTVVGDEACEVVLPFAVRLVPADLVR